MSKPLDRLSKRVIEIREEINKAQQEFPGAGSMLADLTRALDLFTQRANSFPELFSDVKPRPSRQETLIRSAEINLQKQKDLLADMRKRKQYSLANPGRAEVVEHEDVEKQELRVKDAERNLAKVRGEAQAHHDARKEAIRAKQEAERAEYAQSVTSWQTSWRETAAKWRNKDAQPG